MQGASGHLVGIKASWRDSPVLSSDECHQSPLPSNTGLSVSKRHGGGMPGTRRAGLPMEIRFLGMNIPSQTLSPYQSWARRECSPSHMPVVWREQVPGTERWGRDGLWGQEVPGVQRVTAEGSPHPGSNEGPALPRAGHPPQGPAVSWQPLPASSNTGGTPKPFLPCFLNKALHLGKSSGFVLHWELSVRAGWWWAG